MFDSEKRIQDDNVQKPHSSRLRPLRIVIGIIIVSILLCVIAIIALTNSNTTTSDSSIATGSVALESTKKSQAILTFDSNGANSGTMVPKRAKMGDTITLPKCSFARDGYEFDAWLDTSGNKYDPGDTLILDDDLTLAATWVAISSEMQESGSQGNTNGNTVATTEPVNTDTVPSSTSSPTTTFPRKWSGTYIGTSSYVAGDHHISRAVAFNFTTVTESGYLEGICYVGTDDTGAGETYGTCYVSGSVDWSTGAISFQGTAWIDQGGLGDLRQYSGSINFSAQTMGGSAWDVGTGLYETPWNVQAVSQITIWQNGSLTTV